MSREYDDLRADLDSTLRELERVKIALAGALSERDQLRKTVAGLSLVELAHERSKQ